jgi:hypothetical protein
MKIKIVGHVREFQEKRSILAFKIVPAPDPQGLFLRVLGTNRFLVLGCSSVVFQRPFTISFSRRTCICFIALGLFPRELRKLREEEQEELPIPIRFVGKKGEKKKLFCCDNRQAHAPAYPAAAGNGNSSDLQKAVLAFVKATTSSQGASKQDIERSLKHMYVAFFLA